MDVAAVADSGAWGLTNGTDDAAKPHGQSLGGWPHLPGHHSRGLRRLLVRRRQHQPLVTRSVAVSCGVHHLGFRRGPLPAGAGPLTDKEHDRHDEPGKHPR
jgi:hypothetical protein